LESKRAIRLAKIPALEHRHRMESHELLREIFEKKTPKEVSADLELSTSMIYKWAQPPPDDAGSGTANPLDRIEALYQSTGDERLVQWICQRAGGFFIQNPRNAPHPHQLIPATNQIVQEFADLLHVIATATADEKITTAETKEIRARWEELKTVTEGFVAGCEEGNFSPLKNHAVKKS
jgi:Phage regulatory protein CII (CP76)